MRKADALSEKNTRQSTQNALLNFLVCYYNDMEAMTATDNDQEQKMGLFHTSPNKITEINSSGRFGSFLFFSGESYRMAACAVTTYKIEIDEESIISARRLFWHDDAENLSGLVAELAERLGCDGDTAEALIEETTSIYDVADDLGIDSEDLADLSWDIQHYSARAAVILRFRGVAVSDEQGASYMIDMAGHESDLIEVTAA